MLTKVGGVIVKNNLIYLLVKDGSLQFPEGHLGKGEKLFDAAIREVKEETGFRDLTLLYSKPVINTYTYKNKAGKLVTIRLNLFLFELKSEKQRKTKWMLIEKIKGKWVPINEAIKQAKYKNVKKGILQIKQRLERIK